MSEIEPRINCPKCGTRLNAYERRHRAVWQWIFFPNSRKYQCEHCGKKSFIFNSNIHLAEARKNQSVVREAASGQYIETKAIAPPPKPRSQQKIQKSITSPIEPQSPSQLKEDTKADASKETPFITSVKDFLNTSPASKTMFVDSQQTENNTILENKPKTLSPTLTNSTGNPQSIHTLLDFPNPFIRYQTITTVEDEVNEAKKIHIELQEAINWSMDNFLKSQHFKLGLIKEGTRKLVESVLRNPDAILFLSKIKNTDSFIHTHCIDASILAVLFGRHMGLTKQELNTLALGVLLLDIGKSQVPNAVLEKQNALAPAEIKAIQKHVQFSLDMLKTTDIDEEIITIIENHHERYDGQGYPQHRQEKEISVFAKMASIVDAYDAMTHNRPHRKALPAKKAMDTLLLQRDLQFQAELVDEFTHCLGAYPTGSVVILNTGQAGVVMSQNEANHLQPKILIFRDYAKNQVIAPFMHDLNKEPIGANGKPIFIKAA